MKRVLNLSLGSSKRNFNNIFHIAGHKVLVERIGTDGDFRKFLKIASLSAKYDAIALGGINAQYCFENKKWPLRQFKSIKEHFTVPLYDGHWIKFVYEPYVLEKILSTSQELYALNWLVFSSLDRYASLEFLSKNNIKVSIGDAFAAFNLPIFFSQKSFKVFASLLMPFLSFLPIKYFYPYKDNFKQQDTKSLAIFDVILSETNFILRKNFTDFKNKTLVLSRIGNEEREYLFAKGVKELYTLLPGEMLSANIIEAMVGVTIGFDFHEKNYICKAIDEIHKE